MKLLDGVRVLDFSRFVAGPYATWLLASLGAEVIRVEAPRGGLDRYVNLLTETGDNVIFLGYAAGKKCITLDFSKGDEAQRLLAKLVEKSDVVLENLGSPLPEKWGLSYEALREIKPDVILVHITAYGSTGPYKDRTGFDQVAQAMSGAVSITGLPQNPVRFGLPYVDFATATNAALGVVCALFHRYKTGEGQKIELSMLRSAVTWSNLVISEYLTTKIKREPQRLGNRGYWTSFSDLCETKDGKWVMVSFPGPLLKRLFRAMEREDLASDPRFDGDLKAFENRNVLDPIIKEWIASKTMEEVEEIAQRLRMPIGPYVDYTEVADHPQVKAENMLIQAALSDGTFTMPVPACPIRFSQDIFTDNVTIPKLGEHNEEIWGRICGLSREQLANLKESGVI